MEPNMLEDYYKNPSDYEVITLRESYGISREIEDRHKIGWFLLGPVTTTSTDNGNLGSYIATMLRKKKVA